MTLAEAYQAGKQILLDAGIREYGLDAWYLLEFVTGVNKAAFYLEPQQRITESQKAEFLSYIRERAKRVPLQYLTGEQEFMGLVFSVNRHVLIPRQDTEILVETALEWLNSGSVPAEDGKVRMLDLCTGSGCILLSVLYYGGQKGKVEGTGTDISQEALKVARKNAELLDIKAAFVQSDLFEKIEKKKYGMIVSNPPYIKTRDIEALEPEVREHEPLQALDGSEDGLSFYRRILRQSGNFLEEKGVLLLEIGYNQGAEIAAMMRENGYADVTVKKDLAGLDRVVFGVYDR